MLADNKEGAQVVFAVEKPEEATKWILFDNGGGWSIIHAASGEYALIRTEDAETTTLSINMGAKVQKWVIKLQ